MEKSTASRVLLTLFRILFTLFVLWTILFIFRNSLESGVLSSARSQAVTAAVNQHLGRVGLSPLSNALVRKLAHFGEYLLLGFGYTLCLRVYTRRYIRHISWPLLLGLLVANVDETLQCYVAGRSSSLRDVWIDFAGCGCGVAAALCALVLIGGRPGVLHPEFRAGPPALLLRRTDYGQVPGPDPRTLPLCPGRGGYPRCGPEGVH